jgi:hypothetical protein
MIADMPCGALVDGADTGATGLGQGVVPDDCDLTFILCAPKGESAVLMIRPRSDPRAPTESLTASGRRSLVDNDVQQKGQFRSKNWPKPWDTGRPKSYKDPRISCFWPSGYGSEG